MLCWSGCGTGVRWKFALQRGHGEVHGHRICGMLSHAVSSIQRSREPGLYSRLLGLRKILLVLWQRAKALPLRRRLSLGWGARVMRNSCWGSLHRLRDPLHARYSSQCAQSTLLQSVLLLPEGWVVPRHVPWRPAVWHQLQPVQLSWRCPVLCRQHQALNHYRKYVYCVINGYSLLKRLSHWQYTVNHSFGILGMGFDNRF